MMTRIPNTDSIRELANYWDTHDLTEVEDQFVEVTEPVFVRSGMVLSIPLSEAEASALNNLADWRGMDAVSLVRAWVRQNVQPST